MPSGNLKGEGMSTEAHVKKLAALGDPLERVIVCHFDQLQPALAPYAGIWYQFIEPLRLRDNPSRVPDEWMAFAGDHYTAIIRVYHAYKSYLRLLAGVQRIEGGDSSAEVLLDVHDATASFWEHIGSVIDNLGMCYKDAPGIKARRLHRDIVAPEGSWLGEAYDRRTQFIHSRIVPKGLWGNDTVVFNLRAFDAKEGVWAPTVVHEEVVSDYYKATWQRFLHEIGGQWSALWGQMKHRHGDIEIKTLEFPDIDFSKLKPGDIWMTDGPSPISTIRGDDKYSPFGPHIPPSGTR